MERHKPFKIIRHNCDDTIKEYFADTAERTYHLISVISKFDPNPKILHRNKAISYDRLSKLVEQERKS